METKDDNYTASDMVNFQSGVNLGYSLEEWGESPELVQTVNSIAKRNAHLTFYRGITKGYERALLDRSKEKHSELDQRMSEIFIAQNKTKDEKDLER